MRISNLKFILPVLLTALFFISVRAQEENSSDCVRAKPKAILGKKIFPKAKFRLEKNKSYPFEFVGFEMVRLKNGDGLTIKNYGCENYSLDFRFETNRFKGDIKRAKYWYRAAVQLMNSVIGGLKKDEYLPVSGAKALNSYVRKNKTVRYNKEIDFGGKDIRSVVFLPPVKKSRNGKYTVEISFGIGPL